MRHGPVETTGSAANGASWGFAEIGTRDRGQWRMMITCSVAF